MITDDSSVKMRKFEKVYKAHANNIYKICLYYLRDEKQASDLAVKTFTDYYMRYGGENSKYTFARLVNTVQRLLIDEQAKSAETEAQRE